MPCIYLSDLCPLVFLEPSPAQTPNAWQKPKLTQRCDTCHGAEGSYGRRLTNTTMYYNDYNVLWKDVKRDPKSSENLTQSLPTIRKREGPGSPGSYYEHMIGKKPVKCKVRKHRIKWIQQNLPLLELKCWNVQLGWSTGGDSCKLPWYPV